MTMLIWISCYVAAGVVIASIAFWEEWRSSNDITLGMLGSYLCISIPFWPIVLCMAVYEFFTSPTVANKVLFKGKKK